jgi:hypothetical protein
VLLAKYFASIKRPLLDHGLESIINEWISTMLNSRNAASTFLGEVAKVSDAVFREKFHPFFYGAW